MTQPLWKTGWRFLKHKKKKKKQLGIKPPYDPAIPFLGIYPEETKTEKDTCTPMFTVALFTTAMTWQPRCPQTDERINGIRMDIWYTHTDTMDYYYSAIKMNTFESVLMKWINLKNEVRKKISYINTHIWNLEEWY